MKIKLLRDSNGQALTEYLVLISVIGISCLGLAKFAKVMIVEYFIVFVNIFGIPVP